MIVNTVLSDGLCEVDQAAACILDQWKEKPILIIRGIGDDKFNLLTIVILIPIQKRNEGQKL